MYSRVLRHEIHTLIKNKYEANLCYLTFGPTDMNEKTKRMSSLLSTKSEGGNIAMKSITDILTIQETVLREQHSQVRMSILQIYNNELHDLLLD